MLSEITFFITGIVLGIAGTISPGPLLTLVISETLKYNLKEGIKISIAPLITDGPIILFIFIVLKKLANYNIVIGIISIIGSIYLMHLAYQNISIKRIRIDTKEFKSNSVKKGILANFLNPYPYIFWIFVGGPILVKTYEAGVLSPIAFLLAFYTAVVGTLISIAFIVQRFRNFLNTKIYTYIVKILGLILVVFSFIFLKEGLNRIGIF